MKLDVGVTGDLVGLRGDQELWKRVMGDESSVHAGRQGAVHFVTGVSRDLSPGRVLTHTQLSRRRDARNLPEQSWGHWSLLPFQLRLRPTSLRLTAEWLVASSRCKHE